MKDTLLILVKCFFIFLGRGPSRVRVANPKRICIIQTAQIGDMVCTTPMFRAIKAKYPGAKILVIGTAINQEVLAGHPDVDKYLVWSGAIHEMSRVIKEYACDFGCTTSPNFTGLAALYLAGVPSIAVPRVEGGVSPYETRPYKLLRLVANLVPYRIGEYTPLQYLRLLEGIGITTSDTTKSLAYSLEGEKAAEIFIKEHDVAPGFVIIAPGAGGKIKTWPGERFAKIAEHISQSRSVVVIGGPRDSVEVASVFSALSLNHKIIDASEKFSMDELKAFIAKAALFVSGDTGPIYIAEAFGVATVDIVGPVAENEQPPCGEKHLVVVPLRASPAIHLMSASVYDAKEARRQAEATTVEEVIAAVDSLLVKI